MPSPSAARQPSFFLPHGGGPCFFMQWPAPYEHAWDRMAAYLRGVASSLPRKPDAVVIVSGHWEAETIRATTNPAPSLLFDYYGFPPHTYQLRYPAPGDPSLAQEIVARLDENGFPARGDAERGFDHGVFIPLLLAFPEADTPVVELSLRHGMSGADALAFGASLSFLRDRNVLILGTGMSYHNLRGFRTEDPSSATASAAFDSWLTEAATAEPAIRAERLAAWETAPFAHTCHPTPEHLLPLMVAAGAAGTDQGTQDYADVIFGKHFSAYRFG